MKYFEVQEAPEHKYAPRLENWYGSFDVRDIRLETFPELPQRLLYTIEQTERLIFTDFILFPFLLVSPKVRDVLKMYRECCFYRDVFLLDQVSGQAELYFLPVFVETNELLVAEVTKNIDGEPVMVDENIFWIRDSLRRHTIISLNLAESLLRRGVTGLGIKEVEIFIREKERRKQ